MDVTRLPEVGPRGHAHAHRRYPTGKTVSLSALVDRALTVHDRETARSSRAFAHRSRPAAIHRLPLPQACSLKLLSRSIADFAKDFASPNTHCRFFFLQECERHATEGRGPRSYARETRRHEFAAGCDITVCGYRRRTRPHYGVLTIAPDRIFHKRKPHRS